MLMKRKHLNWLGSLLVLTLTSAQLSRGIAAEVPEEGRSAHLEAVAKYLDFGGVFYAYADVDGDLEGLAEGIEALLQSEGVPLDIRSLNLVKVIEPLGITQVKALGMSSYARKDGHYVNKAMLYVPDGRVGLLKLLGGEPGPLLAHKIAPADADLIFEQDLDLGVLVGMVKQIMKEAGGERQIPNFERALLAPAVGPISVNDLLDRGPGKVTVIARINGDKRIRIPDGPSIADSDIVIALDGFGWIFPLLKGLVPPAVAEKLYREGDGFKALMTPPPPEPFDGYSPLLYLDDKEDRLFLATRRTFLDECLGADGAVLKNEDFVSATAGLPKEGNGMTYFSPDVLAELVTIMKQAAATSPDDERVFEFLADRMLPELESGVAHVNSNVPEGILWASNSTSTHKTTAYSALITPLAIVSSFAVPVFTKVIENSQSAKNMNTAKLLGVACNLYRLDHGKFPEKLEDLDGEYFEWHPIKSLWLNPGSSEFLPWMYFGDKLEGEPAPGAILLASPESFRGERMVILSDGSYRAVSEAIFFELLEKQFRE